MLQVVNRSTFLTGAMHMRRGTIVRSFLSGLGVIAALTACGSDSLSGPQTQAALAADSSAAAVDTVPPTPDSLTAAALATASESPPPPADSVIAPGPPQPAIMRSDPLKKAVTVNRVIGAKGGEIKIPQVGLTVIISPGAVLQNTEITVTADAGSLISYEFGPHGTQFLAPVAIEQDMQQTTIGAKTDQATKLYGGYMPHGTSDIAGDSARVSEIHQAQTSVGPDSLGRPSLKQSVFIVWHFSGYILIGARS